MPDSFSLPCREKILALIRAYGKAGIYTETIRTQLKVSKGETLALERRLCAMSDDFLLKYFPKKGTWVASITHKKYLYGKVVRLPSGFGFLTQIENGVPDIYIAENDLFKVMHGDWVYALKSTNKSRGYMSGKIKIVEVVKRSYNQIVGRLEHSNGIWTLKPYDARIPQQIIVSKIPARFKAQAGNHVVVSILSYPDRMQPITAALSEVLTAKGSSLETDIALRRFELPNHFPAKMLSHSKRLARQKLDDEITKRRDLRHIALTTIDGESAKDFDDAVFCETLENEGYRLYVAIADVSFYVQDGDELDEEARRRGTSVYFPREVIPMLPESLSNGACSLLPHEDRLTLVCEILLNPKAEVTSYHFYEAVIRSAARLTYTQVAQIITKRKPTKVNNEIFSSLKALSKLTKKLLHLRDKRNALELNLPETAFIFNQDDKIDDIVAAQRNFAHRMIEEAMLLANVCTATFLQKTAALFRVHPAIEDKKLEQLIYQLEDLGYRPQALKRARNKSVEQLSKALAQTVKATANLEYAETVQTLILRSLQQARYDYQNSGHSGLAYRFYTHFTSPIRRYPDLLTHRVIKAKLKGTAYQPRACPDTPLNGTTKHAVWKNLALHCSQRERVAEEASRDIQQYWKCRFMKERLGQPLRARVSGSTPGGIFACLENWNIQGFISAQSLEHMGLYFENRKRIWRSRQRFLNIGEKIVVITYSVKVNERLIEFELQA